MRLTSTIIRCTVLICTFATLSFAQTTTFSIIHVNDTHSHLDGFGPKDASLNGQLGGIAKAATAIGIASTDVHNRLLLHAGDMFVGDLFFNTMLDVPELVMLSQLGFDAVTVGNHEMDLGPDALGYAMTEAGLNGGFPQLISANIENPMSHPVGSFILPYITKTFGDLKVGVFGLTIPNPLSNPAPLIVNDDIPTIAYQTAMHLRRNEGCQVVILLSHCGVYVDQQLAAGVPGIDAIIGGHDHYLFTQPIAVPNPYGGTTWIAQAGSYYQHVGKMTLTYDYSAQTVTMDGYTMYDVDAMMPPYAPLQAEVDVLKAGVEASVAAAGWNPSAVWGPQIGNTPRDIEETFDPARRERDTPAGNLVTDAYLAAQPEADIAITALGLIADKLYKGRLVPADIFRLVPYGFDPTTMKGLRLVTCSITGMELLAGLEVGVGELDMGDDFVIQVAGMSFEFDATQPAGSRVDYTSVRINKRPINPSQTYTLVTNEAIAGLFTMYGITVTNLVPGPFEYDAVLDFVSATGSITTRVEGRMLDMSVPKHGTPKAVPAASPLALSATPSLVRDNAQVSFTLDAPGEVMLTVHDLLGRTVATLASGALDAGSHQARFEAAGLPAGVYYVHLASGAAQRTQSIRIIK